MFKLEDVDLPSWQQLRLSHLLGHHSWRFSKAPLPRSSSPPVNTKYKISSMFAWGSRLNVATVKNTELHLFEATFRGERQLNVYNEQLLENRHSERQHPTCPGSLWISTSGRLDGCSEAAKAWNWLKSAKLGCCGICWGEVVVSTAPPPGAPSASVRWPVSGTDVCREQGKRGGDMSCDLV